jgi:hypothetical protein
MSGLLLRICPISRPCPLPSPPEAGLLPQHRPSANMPINRWKPIPTDIDPPQPEVPAFHTPNGLSTPATSLSKATGRYLQTPAAPGAWAQTPAARKVRFDPDANGTREFVGESDASASDMTDGLNSRESQTQTVSPPATPELAGSPLASSRVKKMPSIRVLDAYGNEQSEELDRSPKKATTKPRASIRVLDSLGQPTDDESVDERVTDVRSHCLPEIKVNCFLVCAVDLMNLCRRCTRWIGQCFDSLLDKCC